MQKTVQPPPPHSIFLPPPSLFPPSQELPGKKRGVIKKIRKVGYLYAKARPDEH